jgi:hypothetical protein
VDPTIVFFIAVAIFVVILFGIFSYQQQQQRRADLASLANDLGWQFDPDSEYSFDSEYSQFGVFARGSGRYAYNTLGGKLDVAGQPCTALMGDYHYQTTSSDGKTTQTHHHHFSYLIVDLPFPSLPDLRIRREGFFDTLAHVFGFDDINFESSEFSKRFHVKSSNKKFAYDVVCPAMIDFLMTDDPPNIEIDDGCCCLTTGSSTWSPAEFRAQHDWAVKFFSLWPKYLVADLKTH